MAINPNPYGPGPQDIKPFRPEPISPLIPPLDRWKESERLKREDAIRQIQDSHPLRKYPDFFDPTK